MLNQIPQPQNEPFFARILSVKHEIPEITEELLSALISNLYGTIPLKTDTLRNRILFSVQSVDAFSGVPLDSASVVDAFLTELVSLSDLMELDITAALDGDPAASSRYEILLCYPGFFAVEVYRLAHILYTLGVPLLPRLFTEYAHRQTGIDIHPGATIGKGFFIDHGTGVVIGQTANVGDRVRIYQGVTLGTKSVKTTGKGMTRKRHPTVENDTVIYASATVLGGDTTVGAHSIIGAGVLLTDSVPPYSVVSCTPPLEKRERNPVNPN